MLNHEVYRTQWLIIAYAIGAILVFATILTFLALWKTRKDEEKLAQVPIADFRTFLIWVQATFPWILIITMIGTTILGIVYPILKTAQPPNW